MSDAYNYGLGCMLHGMPTSCSTVLRLFGNGGIAGGVISGAGSPLASLMQMGINITPDRVYTAAVRQIPGSSAIAISRIVEGNSIKLTFLEKELRYKPLNIIIYGLTMAPGRQPGVEPNEPQKQKPVDINIIKEAIGECISELFTHYSLVDFKPTTKPPNKGTGTPKDNQYNGITKIRDVGTGQEIEIYSDPTPPADLYNEMVRVHGADGSTSSGNPWWGYVDPNADTRQIREPGEIRYPQLWNGQLRFVRVQTHELGGALHFLYTRYYASEAFLHPNHLKPSDRDDGPPFEDCVGQKVYQKLGLKPGP